MEGFERIKRKISGIPTSVWVMAAILVVGIFLRAYHFGDWLQFKGDAFRDATLVSNIYREGIESLPLLGPRAGGTMLRLGPIFYYFQYVSVSLFHSLDAPVLAYPDFLFSVLSIPMLFFFARRYFSRGWALSLSAMLAVSFLAVEYGRFAWNPDSTLFFTILFSYAVLRATDTDRLADRRRVFWTAVAGLSLAVASQLHFSAFLGLPIVLVLFLLWRFHDMKRILSWRVMLAFSVSVAVVYAPVFASELFKHGENTGQFLAAVSEKASTHGALESVTLTSIMFAKYFLRIALGIVEPGRILIAIGGLLFACGLLANIVLLRGEKSVSRRGFLEWTLLLSVVFFLLYIPLAYKIDRPRFFLPIMVLPYLSFGYIALSVREKMGFPRLSTAIATLGIGVILLGNLHSVSGWFSELRASERTTVGAEEKTAKGRNFWLTWGHYERVAVLMDASCPQGDPILFFMGERLTEYDHSFEYALLQTDKGRPVVPLRKYAGTGPNGCYYRIARTGEDLSAFLAGERSDPPAGIGDITVTRFFPREVTDEVVPERDAGAAGFVPEKRTRNSRVYFGDVLDFFTHDK
jgi:4-amino-4-deoxy-L-arabinose transferase-like glycosyltransferase